MTHPRYPAYRDSGIEWLGEIPEHWVVSALKKVVKQPITDGPHETPEILDDGIPFISAESIKEGRIDFDRKRGFISEAEHARFCLKYRPMKGDIYMIKSGATTGNLAIVETDDEFNIWSPLAAIRADDEVVYPRYVLSAMRSKEFQTSVQLFWSFGTQQNIGMNVLGNLVIPVPPLPEQQSIATFLDRETSKIDGLVAEQERLIELLTEKRQAVISHAVTRGIDPSVPLKDSGVEWLGQIPAHWEVRQLKRDLEFLTSGSRGWAEHYSDDGALFLRIGNLTRNGIGLDLSDIQRVSIPGGSEGERTRVAAGDLLFSITAYLGSVAVVPDGIEEAYVSQHVALAKIAKQRLSPEWLGYLTLSIVGQTYLANQGYGGTKVQLSLDDIACLPVLHPPLSEQKVISTYLNEQTSKFDALMDEARQGIKLLKERRTALISAAVTGKIDVREAV